MGNYYVSVQWTFLNNTLSAIFFGKPVCIFKRNIIVYEMYSAHDEINLRLIHPGKRDTKLRYPNIEYYKV